MQGCQPILVCDSLRPLRPNLTPRPRLLERDLSCSLVFAIVGARTWPTLSDLSTAKLSHGPGGATNALGVIILHVLGAVAKMGREVRHDAYHTGQRADSGPHTVETSRNPSGLYFSVWVGRERMMAGYVNPIPPGKYLGGKVHIMTWRRGEWESGLFDAFRAPPLPIAG